MYGAQHHFSLSFEGCAQVRTVSAVGFFRFH